MDVKQDPYIKSEEDPTASPAVIDEEDLYEDAGDLEFFDQDAPGNPYGTVYLARVPRTVWEAWKNIEEDAEIRIGTIRSWSETLPDGSQGPRLRMLLASDRPEHQLVPKEYTLDLISTDSHNNFIFTEEDLPGFKAKSKARQAASAANIPMSLLRARNAEKQDKPFERRKGRYQPYYRKAIPKKTKIAARIKYELQCKPVNNAETRHLEIVRAQEAMKPKHSIQIVGQQHTNGIIIHGSAAANEKFGNFIKTTAPPKPTKSKKTELKAARIPENELLDRIFQCFRRYEYWGMKELKRELQQPEAYLRMVLEKVAELNKSGPFANKWSLQAGHRAVAPGGEGGPIGEAAPDAGDVGDEDDEGDDDEVKMEDVL